MKQKQYESLVSYLANRLLEDDTEPVEDGETTEAKPSSTKTIKDHPVLVAGAVDAAVSRLRGATEPHHIGSHAALRGETSGTGED